MMQDEVRTQLADPDSDLQRKLTGFCSRRIEMAERHWSQRTDAWREAEQLYRVFRQPDQQDKLTSRQSLTQGVQKIVVPTTYAQIQSMLAFFMSVLTDRRPVIPVEGAGPQDVEPAILMEAVLDYQMQNMAPNGMLVLYQWLLDSLRYGVGVIKNVWTLREWPDVRREFAPMMDAMGMNVMGQQLDELIEEDVVAYEGNEARNISPFDFLPDPRRSMADFQNGEFVFHRLKMSRTQLEQREAEGLYVGVDDLPAEAGKGDAFMDDSDLSRIVNMSDQNDGMAMDEYGKPFVNIHEGYAFIKPEQLGLPNTSMSTTPRLWVFTIANKSRVLRAEPANLPGRAFPYCVIEPNYDIHSPSNFGVPETIRGLQYIMSWLINSRNANVRKSLNNESVVDPSLIEPSDLLDSEPGRLLRLTKSAWGSGLIDKAVFPLPVNDVTANHLNDARVMAEFVEQVTGANRLVMGLSNTGRRSASEVQGQLSLASGRMKMLIELISSQGLRPWAAMMSKNTQMFLENALNVRIQEIYADVVGAQALQVTPQMIQGNFYFPFAEQGMPNDRQFEANIYRELLTAGMQSGVALPALQQLNWMMIVQRMLRSSGVKDVSNFQVAPPPMMDPSMMQMMPPEQVQNQVQQGNLVPKDAFPLPSQAATPNSGYNGMGSVRQ